MPATAYRDGVTRIIAGRAGSLALAVPETGTRPTSDRVRESMFGALESAGLLADASVLDLYAGSGALGLEAVSRGARSADLVDRSSRAAAAASRNARTVGRAVPGARIDVHRETADAYLRRATAVWDLAFLDPPYDLPTAEVAATLELLLPRLAATGTAIVERAARSDAPNIDDGWHLARQRRYGDTTLWWLQRV